MSGMSMTVTSMSMIVKEIADKKTWEDFLENCREKTFLQSWNWGQFQKTMNNKIWRLGVFDNNNLLATVLASKIAAKRGTFLLIQHGPAFALQATAGKPTILKTLISRLKEIAKQENAIFVRMNPLWEETQENINCLKATGFSPAPMHANAYESTWKLDIRPPEQELLKNMRKTTRYLVRQAMKNPNITIEQSQDIETYLWLNKQMAKRQKFTPFSDDYIKKEFQAFSTDRQISLFLGKYNNEVVCGALIVFWSDIGFYHQAASLEKYAKFSIPYLLQWEAIKQAKAKGCSDYDFWGYTDPQKCPHHPWAGPTLFKMGFGGKAYEYVKTQDLKISSKYWLTYTFETIRRFKRGL